MTSHLFQHMSDDLFCIYTYTHLNIHTHTHTHIYIYIYTNSGALVKNSAKMSTVRSSAFDVLSICLITVLSFF